MLPAATIAPVIPIIFIKKILLLDVRGREIRVVDIIVIVWLDTLKPPCLGLGCVTPLIIVEAGRKSCRFYKEYGIRKLDVDDASRPHVSSRERTKETIRFQN